MNKKVMMWSCAFVGALVLTTSCKKQNELDTPAPTPNTPISSNIGSLGDSHQQNLAQDFTIDAGTFNQITASNGTRIMIPGGAFQDAGGNPVTGNVNIEVVEVLDQANMILADMPTTSGGQLLVSGGELRVTPTQGGQELGLTPNAIVSFMVPTNNPDQNMGLFLGSTNNDGDFDWVPADSLGQPDSVNVVGDTLGGNWQDYYYFDITGDSLGWINCDYFYNDPSPKTTLEVLTPTDYDYTNTVVYVHFSTLNSVASLNWDFNDSFDSYANSLPIGLQVTIVALSEQNGDYYSSFTPITIQDNTPVTISMNATTLADFQSALDAL